MGSKNGWSLMAGVAIAVKKNNKFLMLKRSKIETFPGKWEFPAGKLEFFETLEQAAVREMKEETGLDCKKIKYIGYNERDDEKTKRHIIVHDFFANEFEGDVKISEEHDNFKWMDEKQILEFDNVGIDTLEILKKMKSN